LRLRANGSIQLKQKIKKIKKMIKIVLWELEKITKISFAAS